MPKNPHADIPIDPLLQDRLDFWVVFATLGEAPADPESKKWPGQLRILRTVWSN